MPELEKENERLLNIFRVIRGKGRKPARAGLGGGHKLRQIRGRRGTTQ